MIVAFNRRRLLPAASSTPPTSGTIRASVASGLASNVFMPLYGLAYNLAQLIVLGLRHLSLIAAGRLTVGLLIGFLLYVEQLLPAAAPARGGLVVVPARARRPRSHLGGAGARIEHAACVPGDGRAAAARSWRSNTCSSAIPAASEVLRDATFALEPGKTYALVGPTGGGKTTTASLMARLYDPTRGPRAARRPGHPLVLSRRNAPRKIGFILQEPFLFTGTVRDNVALRQRALPATIRTSEVLALLAARNLDRLLSRFEQGLETKVTAGGDGDQPRPEAAHRVHARRAARAGDSRARRSDRQHRHRDRAAARTDPATSCRRRRPR